MKFKIKGKNIEQNKEIKKDEKNLENIKNNKKYTVNFYTLGCRTNTYETFAMMAQLKKAGFNIVPWENKADFSIVNSCSVTNMSERKTRQVIRGERKKNPKGNYICIGCYSQHAKPGEIDADLILGNNEKLEIDKYINEYIKEKNIKPENENIKEEFVSDIFEDKKYKEYSYNSNYIEEIRTRAIVKIQDGCDRFCTYCIIPFLRGRVRSRKPENILDEIKVHVQNGAKEVVLTGIHMSSYGKDFEEEKEKDKNREEKQEKNEETKQYEHIHNLVNLLEQIDKIEGLERIRIGSLEPRVITDEFISRIKKLKKLCPQFHLSLQSACDETLKRMKRKYTIEEYMLSVKNLKEEIYDARITTDVMVGFPGETDNEFNETYENLKKLKLFKMHVFKYSKRDGTIAAKMKDQVDGNIKNIRSKKLLELNRKNALEYLEKDLGRELEVLIEQEKNGIYFGYTKNYTKIGIKEEEILKHFKGESVINEIIKVKAKSIENKDKKDSGEFYLLSEII